MSRRLLNFAAAGALALGLAPAAFAQETQPQPQPQPQTQPQPQQPQTQTQTTTVTTTTQTAQAVQNPDGSWTVVHYPAGKEVVVDFTPAPTFSTAKGRAKIMRMNDQTMVSLDLSGLPADAAAMNLYAVDPLGKVTMLGPVTFNNGVSTASFHTPLDRFMLVLSPEANLTSYTPTGTYAFRSAVPQGFAVVPMTSAEGERVAATSTAGATTAFTAPMLGIPSFDRGDTTQVKVNLAGALTGARVNFNITPRRDGPTQVVARFHELKEAPAGQVYVLWAVSPDNKYTKLGQVVNTGQRNEAEIKSETTLADFGLLITLQPEGDAIAGDVVGTVIK
ncbi:MAG TPA: anti-sigma factor [Pyrinomonadaceae bacterium]|nr:anti-sigma factor [Pyrinomonadaceae bacterium]